MGLASSINERRTAELGMRTTTLRTNIGAERSLNLKKKVLLRWPRTASPARLLLHLLQPDYFSTRCGLEKKKERCED